MSTFHITLRILRKYSRNINLTPARPMADRLSGRHFASYINSKGSRQRYHVCYNTARRAKKQQFPKFHCPSCGVARAMLQNLPFSRNFLTISTNTALYFFLNIGNVRGRHNLTIFLDNFSTNFRRNSTRKIVRWFEKLINLNHLTIFITEFHQKLVEKLSKKIQLSLSHSSLLGRYFTLP